MRYKMQKREKIKGKDEFSSRDLIATKETE